VGAASGVAYPDWTSTTFLPLMAKKMSLHIGDRSILMEDAFEPELLRLINR